MIRRKWLSLCIALVLCLLLLPAAALAAEGDSTVYVGSVELTSTGGASVYATTDAATGAVTAQPTFTEADSWNIKWDGSTLTLRNATIKEAKEYGNSRESMAIYRQSGDLAIVLVGENTVDAPGNGTAASCGINLGSGSLTISGEDGASLTVFGGDTTNTTNSNSCGIYANGTITINSGTVTATGESASAASYGICARGAVTIEGGTVNATSGEAGGNSVGIQITNSITINGGDVTATAGDAGGNSYGIHTAASSTDITVNGGSVTATSGEAKGDSCGIFVESKELASIYSSIAINGGSVTAKGGDAVGTGWYSCGIKVDGNFTISGGTITAKGGDARGADTRNYSIGLFAHTDLTIKGGTVIATGVGAIGTTTDLQLSFGIFSLGNVNISGGDVTGIGGTGGLSGGIVGNHTLTITGGTVVGEGGPLAGTNIQYSAGINGMDKVEISGGTVTATGGTTEQGNSGGIYSGDTSSAQLVEVTIKNATVTATGGTATNGKSSGIFASNVHGINVQVTIEDATVTTTGGAAEQGSYGILAETTGTEKSADVTINGNSVVRANMTGMEDVDGEPISGDSIDKRNGIVFENGEGTVYGNVTLREDLTVDANERLTIPQGAALTIPSGVTLTNSGDITNKGTITNNGILTIAQGGTLTGEVTGNPVVYTVTVQTDGKGSASASAPTAEAGTTVILTADPDNGWRFSRWEVVEGDVTISGNSFTMPDKNVTVRAVFSPVVNIPDTHEIELIVGEGGKARLSLTNASEGSTITVTATPDDGYELDYITVDGERIDGTTFTMPDHDVTVRVYFTDGAALPFTDVSAGAWYFDAVGYVYVGGLMDGVSDTLFDPDGTMTRAMVWAILARVDGETVTGEDWIETAREWAVAEGVSDGENATDYVTREQFATMLWRYAGEPETDGSGVGVFDDGETVSIWAFDAMSWALNNGVITGVSDDALLPANTATRAQCAAMLMRFVETNS